MKDICVLIDDDASFVQSWAVNLDRFLRERFTWELDPHLKLGTLVELVESKKEVDVKVAIVDLWLVNKDDNKSSPEAGLEAIALLRKRWPGCFVIVYSGHLDGKNKLEIPTKFNNISLIDKKMPSGVVEREIIRAVKKGQL